VPGKTPRPHIKSGAGSHDDHETAFSVRARFSRLTQIIQEGPQKRALQKQARAKQSRLYECQFPRSDFAGFFRLARGVRQPEEHAQEGPHNAVLKDQPDFHRKPRKKAAGFS
jgi:hypothetical protein